MAKGTIKTHAGRTVAQQRAFNKAASQRLTPGKVIDMGAFGAAGIMEGVKFAMKGQTGEEALHNVVKDYAAYNISTGKLEADWLVRGWGPVANTVIEKKLNKALGIRRPRGKIKTFGDILDWVSYFGPTAADAFVNKDNPVQMTRVVLLDQYGVDYNQTGLPAYKPQEMFFKKLLPYYGQKILRKVARDSGLKMPKIMKG